ncbi:MAG TPA: maleylpyruvate isomerase N-terminal domain-containing protein [Terriglobales bacterium]|nr:maleylpyruvate isomerase N-terminal domain-containing protein [Terriglobales bacterium]
MATSPTSSAKPDLRPLFPELERRLIRLLRACSAEDWGKPTIAGQWTVKDVTAHLLDTSLRRLSMARDGFYGEKPEIGSYQDLVDFLNRLNADWVKAMRRVSPAILIEQLESSSAAVHQYFQSLDLSAPAPFSVAWAGEQASENWFDIAREYTERWHHQQQIRLALGRESGDDAITSRELYFPVLDTFMYALPHHYRDRTATEGVIVRANVSGAAGGSWCIQRTGGEWKLSQTQREATAEVTIPDDIAWRVVTKGISRADAIARSSVHGDRALAEHIFSMLSIMA